jgi:hypothetical protein
MRLHVDVTGPQTASVSCATRAPRGAGRKVERLEAAAEELQEDRDRAMRKTDPGLPTNARPAHVGV